MKKKKTNQDKVGMFCYLFIGLILSLSCVWAVFYLCIIGYKYFNGILHLDSITNIELLRVQANFVCGIILLYGFSRGFEFALNDFLKISWHKFKE